MNAIQTRFWRSPVALTALVGFIVLLAALMAGFEFVNAGHEKWGDPAWTGSASGVAIQGFLKGADAKSIQSSTNPYPEVKPITRQVNQRLFSQHARLFSWLTVAGEVLLPIGIMALLLVRFRRSRALLIALAMLAASLNFLYLTEGDSSANPPMVFMWLAIIWIAALWPTAARFYAVDLGKSVDQMREHQEANLVEPGAGPWFFFGAILLIVVAGSLQMYWDRPGTFAALAAGAITLTSALTLVKRRTIQQSPRTAIGPMTVDPGRI